MSVVLFGNTYALGKLHLIFGYQPSAYDALVKYMVNEILSQGIRSTISVANDFSITPEELLVQVHDSSMDGDILFVPDLLESVGSRLEYGARIGGYARTLLRIAEEKNTTIFFFVPKPLTSLMYLNNTATQISFVIKSVVARTQSGPCGAIVEVTAPDRVFGAEESDIGEKSILNNTDGKSGRVKIVLDSPIEALSHSVATGIVSSELLTVIEQSSQHGVSVMLSVELYIMLTILIHAERKTFCWYIRTRGTLDMHKESSSMEDAISSVRDYLDSQNMVFPTA